MRTIVVPFHIDDLVQDLDLPFAADVTVIPQLPRTGPYCAEGEGGQVTPVDVEFDDDGTAVDVRPGTIMPADPDVTLAAAPAPAADDHQHTTPATGGGLTGMALALLGATALASRRLTRP